MSAPAILEGALLAQAAGFAVHYQRGKRAFEPRWSTLPPKIAEELRRDYRDIGFRTGHWSKLDGWPVVVLDADIRVDDPAHREAARQRFRLLVYPDARRWQWRDRAPREGRISRRFVCEALADFDPLAWGAAPADDFAKFSHFRFSAASFVTGPRMPCAA
jgi:hypothetical protein